MPPKVAESGVGYTLSGKPLDPFSACAQQCGLKVEKVKGVHNLLKKDLIL